MAAERALQAKGVVANDRVTIALGNSVEFVATVIACWKIGATPQPVSSRLPERELAAIIELAGIKRYCRLSFHHRFFGGPGWRVWFRIAQGGGWK